jgi:hypothetical protein
MAKMAKTRPNGEKSLNLVTLAVFTADKVPPLLRCRQTSSEEK